jgi:hypothetical protein
MRQISEAIKSLLKHSDISELRHKLLLYRRKWDIGSLSYIVETTPIDITDAINHNGTNVSITQQLDNDNANVWKVGNLALTLYNDNNRFWQDKEKGLFPQSYTIYGSKIEYYIGSPELNDYVKCFTGYLTELPHYRQDEGLVEIRVLDRLEWLKTISAENVSSKVTAEKMFPPGEKWEMIDVHIGGNQYRMMPKDTTRRATRNAAVGRVQRVLRGKSFDSAVVLQEKTDYTISQLNNYHSGAIIELKTALTLDENIWADYMYWQKGITIDNLVNQLLTAGGVDSEHRIVEPVVFHNTARVAEKISIKREQLWMCSVFDNGLLGKMIKKDDSKNYYLKRGSEPNDTKRWACHMYLGSIKFTISENTYVPPVNPMSPIYEHGIRVTLGDFDARYITISFDSFHNRNVPTPHFRIKSQEQMEIDLGIYSLGDTFIISFDESSACLCKNGSVIWNSQRVNKGNNSFFKNFTVSCSLVKAGAIRDLQASPEAIVGSRLPKVWYDHPFCLIQTQKTESGFLGFEKLDTTVDNADARPTHVLVSYGNNMSDWTPFVEYKFGAPMPLNYDSLQIIFKNVEGFKSKYNPLDIITLWSFLRQNIPLGVCNLTNMSVFQALKELASLAMYEMGFDANDKFFFRRRHQITAVKTIGDDEIISMDGVQYDVSRLKTRVVVGYGGYTKIVDSDTQQEPHPTNKDKYGQRTYEISGSQLLPADNVDLAYAVAPTIYSELSKLRLTLSIKKDSFRFRVRAWRLCKHSS